MKKRLFVFALVLAMTMAVSLTGCGGSGGGNDSGGDDSAKAASEQSGGNYTDEMKLEHTSDISKEDGADSAERNGDHKASPYFNNLDFYNMESNDTLTILPKFKTIQQSSEWSCGVASAMMVLNYYDKLGDYTEESLAALRPNKMKPEATTLKQAMAIFEKIGGFKMESTFDYGDDIAEKFGLATIQDYLKNGTPVMICWNDWGGHWQVIIGYDTMGTETEQDDVIIVADPYDTTDHNQDGYGVYGAERFFYNFTTYDFFDEKDGNDFLFLAVTPEK